MGETEPQITYVPFKTLCAKGDIIPACLGRELQSMSGVKRPATQKSASVQARPQSDPAAESELEPVTASEVRIKLDLARQFIDMGDPESARHMLDEVLKEGDQAQKQEAQRLLDSLPRSP